MNEQTEDSIDNVGAALTRLHEAIEQSADAPLGSVMIDGTIQRFEFCIELMWKFFRRLMIEEGQDVELLPKPIMRKAFMLGWIDDEKTWLAMLDDRNKTSHTYQQLLAMEIFGRIKTYYPILQQTYNKLTAKYLRS